MKRILAIGRVRNGGAIELVAPEVSPDGTLEERIATQIARNAEILAMNADLDALLAGKPVGYRLTAAQVAELDNENPGLEYSTQPWRY